MHSCLFICNTVYQLFNAINIITSSLKEYKTDLIISSIVRTDGVVEGCKASGLFRNIFFVDKEDLPPYEDIEFNNEKQCSFAKAFVQANGMPSHYSVVYFANIYKISAFGLYIASYYHSVSNSELRLYENGLGNYTNEIGIPMTSVFIDDHFKEYNNGIQYIKEMYVYNPNSVQWKTNVSFKQIVISDLEYTKSILKKVFFKFDLDHIILPKNIFFLQPINLLGCNKADIKELILQLADILTPERLFLKQHPRRQEQFYNSLGLPMFSAESPLPWEILLVFEKNRIVHNYFTVFSTAAINSANYSECKCNVFFLNECLNNNTILVSEGYNEYLAKEKNNFYNPVYIPNTIDELKQYTALIKGGSL